MRDLWDKATCAHQRGPCSLTKQRAPPHPALPMGKWPVKMAEWEIITTWLDQPQPSCARLDEAWCGSLWVPSEGHQLGKRAFHSRTRAGEAPVPRAWSSFHRAPPPRCSRSMVKGIVLHPEQLHHRTHRDCLEQSRMRGCGARGGGRLLLSPERITHLFARPHCCWGLLKAAPHQHVHSSARCCCCLK